MRIVLRDHEKNTYLKSESRFIVIDSSSTVKLNKNAAAFIQENAFENIV